MNKNNKQPKKNSNGTDVLPPDLEYLKQQVLRSEYRSRLWKADYETAYYSIELDKIAPEYRALLERQRKESEEMQKKHNDILDEIKKNSGGDVTIEEVPEGQEVENAIGIEIGEENIE